MRSVFKYRSEISRDIELLKQSKLYAPTIEKLNDPSEGLVQRGLLEIFRSMGAGFSRVVNSFDGLLEKQKTVGIYSLSNTHNDELLWAHYADSHRGFCIEYDLDLLVDFYVHDKGPIQFASTMEVDYKPQPPAIILYDITKDGSGNLLRKLLGTKSMSWGYEKETRIIFDSSGALPIDHRSIKSVTFGVRTDSSVIQDFIDTVPFGLDVYQAVLQPDYKIERALVTSVTRSEESMPVAADFLVVNEESVDYDKYKSQIEKAIELVRHEPYLTDIFYAGLDYEYCPGKILIRINANRDRAFSPWPVKFLRYEVLESGQVVEYKS